VSASTGDSCTCLLAEVGGALLAGLKASLDLRRAVSPHQLQQYRALAYEVVSTLRLSASSVQRQYQRVALGLARELGEQHAVCDELLSMEEAPHNGRETTPKLLEYMRRFDKDMPPLVFQHLYDRHHLHRLLSLPSEHNRRLADFLRPRTTADGSALSPDAQTDRARLQAEWLHALRCKEYDLAARAAAGASSVPDLSNTDRRVGAAIALLSAAAAEDRAGTAGVEKSLAEHQHRLSVVQAELLGSTEAEALQGIQLVDHLCGLAAQDENVDQAASCLYHAFEVASRMENETDMLPETKQRDPLRLEPCIARVERSAPAISTLMERVWKGAITIDDARLRELEQDLEQRGSHGIEQSMDQFVLAHVVDSIIRTYRDWEDVDGERRMEGLMEGLQRVANKKGVPKAVNAVVAAARDGE